MKTATKNARQETKNGLRVTCIRPVPVTRSRRQKRGLGLVEALVSLAISSLLLTAVAVAFTSSARSIESNDRFFRASQAGRVSLARIMTQVRRGAVDEKSTETELRLVTEDGQDITYRIDTTAGKLWLVTNDDDTDPDYVLARNVSQARFVYELGKDYNNTTCVTRVSMEITVRVDNHDVRLSGSAAPRRNLIWY